MGVRPPGNDDTDEPASIEFGIAAVDAQLRDVDLSFPASRAEVERTLGTERIPYDVHGNDVPLSTILEELPQQQFDSRQELLNALHPAFEQYRKQHSGGFLGRLRSFLPF